MNATKRVLLSVGIIVLVLFLIGTVVKLVAGLYSGAFPVGGSKLSCLR